MQRLEGQGGAGSINGMSKLVVLTMKKFLLTLRIAFTGHGE
jgi:hypothetical protein